MKLLPLLTAASALIFASCSQPEIKTDTTTNTPQENFSLAQVTTKPIVLDSASIECSGNCATIELHTFTLAPETELAAINSTWSRIISGKEISGTNNFRANLMDTIQKFNTEFDAFRTEFPEAAGHYEWYEKDSLFYAGENHVTLQRDVYQYWGGAHGSNWLMYYNINKDGKLLDYTDFAQDTMVIKQAAEKAFRSKYNIPENTPINSTGKMFPESGFFLPDSFAVTSDSIIFVFQPYEADAYAFGRHRFGILKSEIE